MPTVYLPQNLTRLFPGAPRRVEVDPGSVLAVIDKLNARWPGLRSRLVDAGPALREHIRVYVDGEPAGLETPVGPGAEVRIIPAITGGREGASTMKILAIFGSHREGGNSELLAEKVLAGIDATRIYLRHLDLQPIVDRRHDPAGFGAKEPAYEQLFRAVVDHDLLLLITPIYWYGLPGHMKDFLDRWSEAMRDSRLEFRSSMRQKQVWLVAAGGDNPRIKGLPLVLQLQHACDFLGAQLAGYMIAEANKPGEVLQDERAMLEAGWLNRQLRRLAETSAAD